MIKMDEERKIVQDGIITPIEAPPDLLLYQAMRENLALIDRLKPMGDLIYWARFFIFFMFFAMILILLKFFGWL
jgi:hypothetical protein